MKKFIVILGFLLMACSGNESETAPDPYFFSIEVVSNCPRVSSSVTATYEVTETTYNRVKKDYDLNTSCFFATFNDLSNTSRRGYVTAMLRCNSCN